MRFSFPSQVRITEVGPRDGLQNEKKQIRLAEKVAFIDTLVASGVRQIEIGAFVSPKWVPQMADSADVFRAIDKKEGVRYIALTPNLKGLTQAIDVGLSDIAIFTAASESFTQKNIHRSIAESLAEFVPMLELAHKNRLWVRGYVSTCFGCPYEGPISVDRVLEVVLKLADLGVDEISLGDTIGVATPNQVWDLVEKLETKIPKQKLALHFHDTRGMAIANVLAGLEAGIDHFDSSAGGLGGCPYAPGASGNLATEDLLYLLDGMKVPNGVDFKTVASASEKMLALLGKTLSPSKALEATRLQSRICEG